MIMINNNNNNNNICNNNNNNSKILRQSLPTKVELYYLRKHHNSKPSVFYDYKTIWLTVFGFNVSPAATQRWRLSLISPKPEEAWDLTHDPCFTIPVA